MKVSKEYLLIYISKRSFWAETSAANVYNTLKHWSYEELELIADAIYEGGI